MPVQFDHETLYIYQASIKFLAWTEKIQVQVPKRHAVD